MEGREGNGARETLFVDKYNSSSTIPKVTKGNGENEGVQVIRKEVGEMRELREVDQNIVIFQIEMTQLKLKIDHGRGELVQKVKMA